MDEEAPPNVASARHAVARDESRRFFRCVRLRPRAGGKGRALEVAFPGSHSDVGGLYGDEHSVADLALAWIAAGAADAGAALKRLPAQTIDKAAAVLHDSRTLASNMWGAFGESRRDLSGVPLHPACAGM